VRRHGRDDNFRFSNLLDAGFQSRKLGFEKARVAIQPFPHLYQVFDFPPATIIQQSRHVFFGNDVDPKFPGYLHAFSSSGFAARSLGSSCFRSFLLGLWECLYRSFQSHRVQQGGTGIVRKHWSTGSRLITTNRKFALQFRYRFWDCVCGHCISYECTSSCSSISSCSGSSWWVDH